MAGRTFQLYFRLGQNEDETCAKFGFEYRRARSRQPKHKEARRSQRSSRKMLLSFCEHLVFAIIAHPVASQLFETARHARQLFGTLRRFFNG